MSATSEMIWQCGPQRLDLSAISQVMGILNTTPDSFSDGGRYAKLEKAVVRGMEIEREGAAILDVGGESTRPGAEDLTEKEELKRVLPVIENLASVLKIPISIDTSKPEVARQALDAGATIINDVSGLRDPVMMDLCAERKCGIVLMHMRGTPRTMMKLAGYADLIGELRKFFQDSLSKVKEAGIDPRRICFDPGIGFAKSEEDNIEILRHLPELVIGSRPLLIGLSRKSFIGALTGIENPAKRDPATVALTAQIAMSFPAIHRTHQIKENVQAIRLVEEVVKQHPNSCSRNTQ